MASDCVTMKNSQSKATTKQNPWWTQSTKIAKSRKISINVLEQYFEQKFSVSSRVITEEMVQAQGRIDAKLKQQSINTEQVNI